MENRRAGATVSWDRQVPAKVATAPESRIDLFHGDAYFIGRMALLVTSAGERWGSCSRYQARWASASDVFQVAVMPGGAARTFDVAALSEVLRYLVVPIILLSRELDFARLTVVSDTDCQLEQRRRHTQGRRTGGR